MASVVRGGIPETVIYKLGTLKTRIRPVILKDSVALCPNCESMGWQFCSGEDKSWAAFLRLCKIENITQLVFSYESIDHVNWPRWSQEAANSGFVISLWACGSTLHSHFQDADKLRGVEKLYPIISSKTELEFAKQRGRCSSLPLFVVIDENNKNNAFQYSEIAKSEDISLIRYVFPGFDPRNKRGLKSQSLHKLFFKAQQNGRAEDFVPCPGLEMLELRHENIESLEPAKVRYFPAQKTPKFSFVIPAFGNRDDLDKVLSRILKLNRKDYEVVLVDDGGKGDLETLFEQYVEQGLVGSYLCINWSGSLSEKPFRAGNARNLGAIHVRGEVICFLDSDILVPSHYLDEVEQALEKYDLVQAVRYDLKDSDRNPLDEPSNIMELSPYLVKFKESALVDWNAVIHPWKFVCTYSLSMKRSLFFEIGGFNSGFNSYGYEDTQFGYSCCEAEKKFGLLASPVFHLNPVRIKADHQGSHFVRYEKLQRSGGLFLRLAWDCEVFSHCSYLFESRSASLFKIQMRVQDFLEKYFGRRSSFS